jgi:hypothetical protein
MHGLNSLYPRQQKTKTHILNAIFAFQFSSAAVLRNKRLGWIESAAGATPPLKFVALAPK